MDLHNGQSGFSMIELVAVIGIVTVGMIGLLSLVIVNLQAQDSNKGYLVASMLAQEGLELVRNKRDLNWLEQTDPWYSGLDGSYTIEFNYGSDNYTITPITGGFSDGNTKLYVDGQGFYTHLSAGNTDTRFRSMVNASISGDSLMASSTVTWPGRHGTLKYQADTVLYDWR